MPEFWGVVPEFWVVVPEFWVAVPEFWAVVPEFLVAVPEIWVVVPEIWVVVPTTLAREGRRAPTKTPGPGPLRPTVGNTIGRTTPLSVRYIINDGETVSFSNARPSSVHLYNCTTKCTTVSLTV